MKGLMDTFPPEHDEGGINYLRRLAMRNGYAGWRGLLRTTGINPTLNAFMKSHKRVALILGLESTWISPLLPKHQKGIGLFDPFFQRATVDAICPACLEQSEHVRHAWSHCFVNACPIHRCLLIDQCPSCNTPLQNSRHGIALCDCGYDLRYGEMTPALPVYCWISARIAEDMQPVEEVEELGVPSDYQNLAKLLFHLTTRYDPGAKVRPKKIVRPKTVRESIAFLEPIATLLEDWRTRFSTHVEMRFAAGRTNAYSLSGRLGAWYTNLHKLCRKPTAFAPLWTVFSDGVLEHFDGVLRGNNVLTPSPGKQRKYLSLPEAAKCIGISAPTLQNAANQNLIRTYVSRPGASYQITMVCRDEAERIRDMRREWLSESQAAKQLGIAESVLQNLVRAGILGFDSGWRQSFYKSGPIPACELAPLVYRLAAFVQSQQVHDTLTFNQLTARRTVDVKALTALYQAIFNGEIRPVGYDGDQGLGGFVFSVEDIKRYLGSVALSTALTLTQLERATGWKYESLSRWVELGLLESEQVLLQGVPARTVTVGAFSRFRQEWLPVSEIAHAVHSKSSAITKRLATCGVPIVGQTNPDTGPRRGGLVRLSDLARLAGLTP